MVYAGLADTLDLPLDVDPSATLREAPDDGGPFGRERLGTTLIIGAGVVAGAFLLYSVIAEDWRSGTLYQPLPPLRR